MSKTTFAVGYSESATNEPAEWTSLWHSAPEGAARGFVRDLIQNGELGHGDEAFVHVRGHGVWRFVTESVVRVASVEKV